MEDRNRNGIPDALEGILGMVGTPRVAQVEYALALARGSERRARVARARPVLSAVVALVLALVVGTAWTFISIGPLETDPWLGAHAAAFCPRSCPGCHGPYVFLRWSSAVNGRRPSSFTTVYCRGPGAPLAQLSWLQLLTRREVHAASELEGGLLNLWAAGVAPWFLALWALLFVLGAIAARARRARAPEYAAEVARLEAALAHARAAAPPASVVHAPAPPGRGMLIR